MVRIVAGCNTAPAEHGGKTDGKVWYVPLTCLAPDIVEAFLNLDGRQPKGLGLAEMLGNEPLIWNEQRSAWGFSPGCAVSFMIQPRLLRLI